MYIEALKLNDTPKSHVVALAHSPSETAQDCSEEMSARYRGCKPILAAHLISLFIPLMRRALAAEEWGKSPNCISIDFVFSTAAAMAVSVLGKRTRGASDLQEQQQHTTRRCTRRTRSFRQGNDENEDPETTIDIEAEDQSESEEVAFFSPSVTRTPSARRTKDVFKFEALDYLAKVPITPSTPRHRDVFAKAPVTPRHRVMSVGKLSRRMTPKTPQTPASSQTIYHQARQLFSRSADPGQLIGREEERKSLRNFLGRSDSSQPNGCLYVSGPPGTGKSAMVNEISNELVAESTTVRKAYINCMSIKSSKDLYFTLLELLCDETEVTEEDATTMLQKIFVPKRKSSSVYVVVLDEIDHILSLDLESLYKVFEWSLQKSSRLLLVGIANALDLTDRFLPRLKSRNLKPELLPFLPYTAAQVKMIITKRLKSLLTGEQAASDFIPFFHPAAIELCSRKVSSQTGDLRKAFEICRRALDLVENETRLNEENDAKDQVLQMTPSRKVLGEMKNETSPGKKTGRSVSSILSSSLRSLTVETAPRVSISHLNKVTSAAFSNGANQRLKTLNLQQKAALCALHALERRNREAFRAPTSNVPGRSSPSTPSSKSNITAPTIKTLFDTYALLCKRSDAVALHPLSSSEFREVVGSLETLSLVAAVDGKNGSFVAGSQSGTPSGRKGGRKAAFVGGTADDKRVASCVGDKEINQAVDGLGADILKSILSGEALD
ncbi:cell division control protein 18 [Diaporthe amygdali]|uniref:cell division control protein 18 n=1 Tax=Phomopsis amygdali TaxID=1214568 RepID=UPI0022FE0DCC|nr:cell division control protein 18 [Diaporthe amygdali]KAJ0121279.1 cell division control protein 18 [Diaporthe amygdali]